MANQPSRGEIAAVLVSDSSPRALFSVMICVFSARPSTRLACNSCCSGPARRCGGCRCGPAQSIEAPFAAAGEPEIEEDEAIDDCQLPAVEQREETSRRVHHEIGDRHIAREDKGDGAGEQTQ